MDWLRQAVLAFLFPAPTLYFRATSDAELPYKKYPGDAGYDLFSAKDVCLEPKTFVDVPTGIYLDIPDGLWVRITGRSSTVRSWGLQVQEGIIDSGYTGELFTGVWNMTTHEILVPKHTRLAQFILHRHVPIGQIQRVNTIRQKDRGSKGFGSTG